jgi:hypothetical protein
MAVYTVVTAQDCERFDALRKRMVRADGPAFLDHDRAVAQYWPLLAEAFPAYQFCLMEQDSGQTVGLGHSIPVAFQGAWVDLPAKGLDWALEQGFHDRAVGHSPTLVSALYIEIAAGHRGHHLSAHMLAVMHQMARSQGFNYLVAPVHPSLKSRYPLIPIDEYMRWQTADGQPFDPWLRVHVRAGGHLLHPCPRAMTVRGSRQQWTTWTGLDFPGDGNYIIPYGLVPVCVRGTTGEYIEPGIWVVHRLQ